MKIDMTPEQVKAANDAAVGFERLCGQKLVLLPVEWAVMEAAGLNMANFVLSKPVPLVASQ